jgi:hypothetical protein
MSWLPGRVKRDENRSEIRVLSSLAVLNILLYWVCIPYRTQQRFMLQALGLLVAPLATLFDRSRWLSVLATVLLGLHLLTPQTWPIAASEDAIPWDLSRFVPNAVAAPLPLVSWRHDTAVRAYGLGRPAAGIASLLAIPMAALLSTWAWHFAWRRPVRSAGRLVVAIAATGVFLFAGWFDLWLSGLERRFEFYPPFPDFYAGWVNFELRSGPRGCRVAYAGTNLPYYLLGNNLRNHVSYVNVDEHRDWLLHDYHRLARRRGHGNWPNPRPGWDRERPDYDAWVRNLESAGIQLLVVTRVNTSEGSHNVADREGFPIERRWADSHPDRFEPLYGGAEHDPWFRLYRFRQSRTDSGAGGHIYRKHPEAPSET